MGVVDVDLAMMTRLMERSHTKMRTKLERTWHSASDGWVHIPGDLEVFIDKTQKVPLEISIVTGELIIPEWVVKAAEVYNKNGGFAGLSLYEYLDKMTEEMAPVPKHTF